MASKYTALVEAKLAPGFAGKVQSELDKAKFKIKIEGLDSKTGSAASALSKGLNQVSTAAKKSKDETQKLNQELTKIRSSTLSNNIQAWMNRNTTAGKTFEAELKNIRSQLSNNTDPAMLKRCTAEFQNVQSKAKAAGLTLQSFASQFVNLGSATKNFLLQMAGLGSAYQIGMKTIGMVKEGIQTIVDLDTALIDLRKTTTMSGNELEDFYYDANEAAKQLGVTTREIIQSAADWSRLGYSDKNSATTMAKLAAQFAAISPGMTIDSATTGLVSIMKAYGIEADEVLDGVMSKINRVGNTAATSNDQIINGLQNSASALAAMNTDLDKSIALFTAGQEIAQADTKVGNALRSISLRIRGYDEETEELSEDLVNITGQVIDLTKVASNNYQGVSLFTDATQTEYKDVYDYLEGISEIWDELDAKTRQTLMEKLFGKNRANIGLAIIQNFDAARKAMDEMSHSAGDADKEMSVIMESLTYKINRFKETGTGIWQNLVKRGDIGAIVDAGTKVLDVIDKITDAIGLLGTALTTGAVAGFIKTIKSAGGLGGVSTLFRDLGAGVELFAEQALVLAPALASVATALLSIYEIGNRISEVNTVGTLGAGHSVSEYEANVKALEEKVAQAQADFDNLSLYDDGSGLAMAQDQLSMAMIALDNAQAEYQAALDKTSESQEDNTDTAKKFEDNLKSLSDNTLKKLKSGLQFTEDELAEFKDWVEDCGYSIDDLVEHLGDLYGLSSGSMEETTARNIGNLTSFRDELLKTSEALETYNKAMEGGEKGDSIASMEEIYKGALEDIQNGKMDTNRLRAAAQMFFSPDQLAQMNYDMEEIGRQLQSSLMKTLFNPEGTDTLSAGQRMIKYIKDNADAFNDVASVMDDGSGKISFYYSSLKDLADAFGISEGAMAAFLDEWDAYGVNVMRSTEENQKLISQYEELVTSTGNAKSAVEELANQMHNEGSDILEIGNLMKDLQNAGIIKMDDSELNKVLENVFAQFDKLEESDPTTTAHIEGQQAITDAQMLRQRLEQILSPPITTTVRVTDGISFEGDYGTGTGHSQKANAKASGGVVSSSGDTLVNELGPELISDDGKAYIANGGKPGFTKLGKGAIVFNADETQKIFRYGFRDIPFPAMAEGTNRKGLIGRLIGGLITKAKAYASGGAAGATYKPVTVSVKKCPRCGSSVASGVQICPYCSYNFAGGGYTTSGTKTYTTTNSGTSSTIKWNTGTASTKYNGTLVYRSTPAVQSGNLIPNTTIGGSSGGSGGGYGGSGGSGGSGSGYNSSSQSDPQKVDWIAVRLDRLNRAVQDLEKIAGSAFKSLEKRLGAANSEVKKLNEEIDANNKGYARYIKEAESVGLDKGLAELVKNGAIDISKYDDNTRQKIEEYKEWYEKALDCKSAIEDLNQQIAELYQGNFDAVQKDYENQLGLIEHEMNMINQDIAMAQAKGMLDSADYYEKLADSESKSIQKMRQELAALEGYFQEAMDSGKIDENSEAWYEMTNEINATKEAIAEANVQLAEYQKTIREIKWGYFDYAQERFGQMAKEAEFLIDLMSNDKLFDDRGQFTGEGMATVGLRAVNYDAYMAQADAYREEMKSIQAELASNPYDQNLIKRREELLGLQQQSILAAEAEKNAMKSLVSEGIQLELSSLKELIDAYGESLDSAKDLYDYQKKVSEKTADIASIQKQLAAYTGDNSEETRARVQKLNNDLNKAQTDLREAEWEQSISDQKKLLDDVYTEYEDLLNERLDNIDLLMKEMIDAANANAESIQRTIFDVSGAVGYNTTSELDTALRGNKANYSYAFEGIASANEVLKEIYSNVNAMARAAGAVKAYASGGTVDYTGLAMLHGSKSNPEYVLSAEQLKLVKSIMQESPILSALSSRNVSFGTSFGGGAGSVAIGELSVNIPIEHVQDYNDLVRQMQEDPKFEKLVSAMTLERANGGSRFAKNKVVV